MTRKKPPSSASQVPLPVVVEAYGDPDDHLRMSTLIAGVVAERSSSAQLRGVARRLTEPQRPRNWRDRRPDVLELVDKLASPPLLTVRDPDAFADAPPRDTGARPRARGGDLRPLRHGPP